MAERAAGAGEGRNDPDAGQPAHDMPLEEVTAPAPGGGGLADGRSQALSFRPAPGVCVLLSVDYLSETRDAPSVEILEPFTRGVCTDPCHAEGPRGTIFESTDRRFMHGVRADPGPLRGPHGTIFGSTDRSLHARRPRRPRPTPRAPRDDLRVNRPVASCTASAPTPAHSEGPHGAIFGSTGRRFMQWRPRRPRPTPRPPGTISVNQPPPRGLSHALAVNCCPSYDRLLAEHLPVAHRAAQLEVGDHAGDAGQPECQ